jgi:hypothetical protein
MAKRFITEWSCDSCCEIYSTAAEASKCHGGGTFKMFACEVCSEEYLNATAAAACCAPAVAASEETPVLEPTPTPVVATQRVLQPTAKIIVARPAPVTAFVPHRVRSKLVSGPKPDCGLCAIAQLFGRVVSCKCMTEAG